MHRFPKVAAASLALAALGAGVGVVAGAQPLSMTTTAPTVYVAQTDGYVAVVNASTGTLTKEIQVGPTSADTDFVAVTPDGSTVYASNNATNTVSVISAATDSVTSTISISGPAGIAITPNGQFAYVGDSTGVAVISTADNAVVANVDMGATEAVAVTPNGTTVYATGSTNGPKAPCPVDVCVTPIATATNSPGTPIPDAGGADVVVGPGGRLVYATNAAPIGDGPLAVISTATGALTKRVKFGNAAGSVWSVAANSKSIYVVSRYDSLGRLVVVGASTLKVVGVIKPGFGGFPHFMVISPNGTEGYVTTGTRGLVEVNLVTDSVIGSVPLTDAYGLAIS